MSIWQIIRRQWVEIVIGAVLYGTIVTGIFLAVLYLEKVLP